MFPSSLTVHQEPRTSDRICMESVQNKHVRPLVQHILGISRQGEQKWGPAEWGASWTAQVTGR